MGEKHQTSEKDHKKHLIESARPIKDDVQSSWKGICHRKVIKFNASSFPFFPSKLQGADPLPKHPSRIFSSPPSYSAKSSTQTSTEEGLHDSDIWHSRFFVEKDLRVSKDYDSFERALQFCINQRNSFLLVSWCGSLESKPRRAFVSFFQCKFLQIRLYLQMLPIENLGWVEPTLYKLCKSDLWLFHRHNHYTYSSTDMFQRN